ncbi:cation/H(+) antiporter 14-like [Papaver somniferum]|uniref:cation/H(+) antiporter 14-like n=1 Tax=Papaver somniferum TaxID=3469 RepID=UPI000E6F8546|nr:cation/H(+) antiporter 14-like [Papaver somniferum]
MNASLLYVRLVVSHSSFYDTACAVADLNLLNSEIGRLGLAISIITGLSSWLYKYIRDFYIEATILKTDVMLLAWISKIFLVTFIMFILHPIMSWMNRTTPEGKTLNEGYVSSIIISVLGVSFYSQSIGVDPSLGPLIVGLTVPVGSPIATAVQKKLECFVTFVLVTPVYIIGGYHVRAFKFIWKDFVVVEIMMFLAYFAKIGFVMLSSLYLLMPILDSFCLGLLLTCDGIINMWYTMVVYEAELMGQQTYTTIFFTNLLITMVITPTVKYLYNPSGKYAGYKRLSILNSAVNSELRILACVYNQENVPSFFNFFEATNPVTKDSVVCIYVLHLVELVGRATSILVEHKQQKKTQPRTRNSSEKIINAFHQFEQQNQGFAIGSCFTAISPFSSMDNDVSQIALDKRTNLVIIPFGELDKHPYRAVNRSVLDKAPCSVGILFDHKNISGALIDVSVSFHDVAMIFIGGPDDREALAYSMRMSDQPNLNLSVFRFTHIESNRKTKKDDELISDLRDRIMNTKNILYREEEVTDCADTTRKIKCLEDSYDFIIVGRRHDSNSPIVRGLDEWCVFKELGVIGDLFATSTFEGNFSVLVLQQ